MKRFAALGLVTILMGQTPYVERVHTPPPEFKQWWDEMEKCSGLTGNFNSVKFFRVNDTIFTIKGHTDIGYADPETRSIFLIAPLFKYRTMVAHEELHMLIGKPGHPVIPFNAPCNVARMHD